MAISVLQAASINGDPANHATTPDITTTAGSVVVVGIGYIDFSSRFVSLVDSKTNSWTQIGAEGDQVNAAGNGRSRLYYSKLTNTGSGHNFTLNLDATDLKPMIVVMEMSGLSDTPLDVNTVANGSSSPVSSGATSARNQADEIIVGFAMCSSFDPTWSAGSGFIIPTSGSVATIAMDYQIVSAVGTDAATFTYTEGGGSWSCFAATFKAASGRYFTLTRP